jgi:diguanylate cyclase (GGDEF)-like protein
MTELVLKTANFTEAAAFESRCEALIALARTGNGQQALRDAQAWLAHPQVQALSADSLERCYALHAVATANVMLLQVREALPMLFELSPFLKAHGLYPRYARAVAQSAYCLARLSATHRALELAQDAIELGEQYQEPMALASANTSMAVVYQSVRDFPRALKHLEQAVFSIPRDRPSQLWFSQLQLALMQFEMARLQLHSTGLATANSPGMGLAASTLLQVAMGSALDGVWRTAATAYATLALQACLMGDASTADEILEWFDTAKQTGAGKITPEPEFHFAQLRIARLLLTEAPQSLAPIAALQAALAQFTQLPPVQRLDWLRPLADFAHERCAVAFAAIAFRATLNCADEVAALGADTVLEVAAMREKIDQMRLDAQEALRELNHARAQRATMQHQLETLKDAAYRDPLTGLYNRRALAMLWAMHRPAASAASNFKAADIALPFSLAFIDIDHFKQINDTWGHATGDTVLQRVAATMLAQLSERGSGDEVVRYAGDEFVVLLPNTTAVKAAHAAQLLCNAIAQMSDISTSATEPSLNVSLSIGVATTTAPGDDSLDALLVLADRALYTAKRNGRAQFAMHSP